MAALAVLLVAGSCDEPERYLVGGTATGVLEPVTLRLEYAGGEERLTVDGDGGFTFERSLSSGDSYAVSLVGSPACVFDGEAGSVPTPGADVTDIALTCDGVASLAGLVLADPLGADPIPPSPGFSPSVVNYEAPVSLFAQEMTVTATTAFPEATLTVNGSAAVSGEMTAAFALDLGTTPLEVVVSHPTGLSRAYAVEVTRGGKIAQHAYVKAHNPDRFDEFGTSVALSGDTLAVGAFGEAGDDTGVTAGSAGGANNDAGRSGAVYVFRRSGTSWTQEAYIKAHNTGVEDCFGCSVALSGDTLAVGAQYEASADTGVTAGSAGGADDGAHWAGAVYVFRRSGTVWAQEAYVKAHNTAADDSFGAGLALSGDTLAVGARYEASADTGVTAGSAGGADDGAPGAGAVYVFRRNGSVWTQEAYIKAHNTGGSDCFGCSVALSGDTLAVGAWYEDSADTGVTAGSTGGADDNAAGAGAVYVFRRSGSVWTQDAYIKAHNASTGYLFGTSVALSGDTLAAGAPEERSGDTGVTAGSAGGADDGLWGAGAVYVFRRSETAWTQEAYVKPHRTGRRDSFGASLALSGDTLAVGAFEEDSACRGVAAGSVGGADNDAWDAGAAYVFRRSGTSWAQDAYVKAHNTRSFDLFGDAVALSGDTLAVGAFQEDSDDSGVAPGSAAGVDDRTVNAGAVYLFH